MTTPLPPLPPDDELQPGDVVKASHAQQFKAFVVAAGTVAKDIADTAAAEARAAADLAVAPADTAVDAGIDRAVTDDKVLTPTSARQQYLSQAPGAGLVEGLSKAGAAAASATRLANRIKALRGVQRSRRTRTIPGSSLALSAANAATTITGTPAVFLPVSSGSGTSVAVDLPDTDLFRWSRCTPVRAGGTSPASFFVAPSGVTSPNGGLGQAVEFHTDALTIDFQTLGRGTTGGVRVTVEGERVLATGTFADEIVAGPPSDGQQYRYLVTLPVGMGQRQRHVLIEMGQAGTLGPVRVPAGRTVTRCNCPRGPRLIVLGDSFTEPTNGGEATYVASRPFNRSQGYVQQAADLLGWVDAWPSGSGGTGYLNPGTGGRVKYRDRVQADVITPGADIVVVTGGINDQEFATAAQVGTEAGLLYDAITTGLPDSLLVVAGPFWPTATPPAAVLAVRDAIKTAALARGLIFFDPLDQQLVTSANAALVTGLDGTHPTAFGHDLIGRWLAANLQSMEYIAP